ncbi:hypothetical protein LDENG_00202580 [Lucifuga dentata]|nr:hypothetical protein LDENG_00202580 [Lucifuga dentata]
MNADSGNYTIMVLLDLTAAFDTVDHVILLDRLMCWVGIKGTALKCFASYLSERAFRVALGDHVSSFAHMSCGVPQGSVLGPVLFNLYMLPLGHMLRPSLVSYHCYADDTQLYMSFKPDSFANLDTLHCCLLAINSLDVFKLPSVKSWKNRGPGFWP